jgi:DNA (cytosine-5)-methyltransferase 1
MARAAEILKSPVVLVENVPTVKRDIKNVATETIKALEAAGYSCAEAILNLQDLGAPQRRRRHVILAFHRIVLDPANILENLGNGYQCCDERTVQWAIEDLIDVESNGTYDTASKPNRVNIERMNWLFDNDKFDLPNDRRPTCHQSAHTYHSMYGRLRWDDPAQTVTTGFGSMGQGRYVHPLRRRTLTPHEAARLQMLPDFFDFNKAKGRGAISRMIGNAVPPILGIAIAEAVLPQLIEIRKNSRATQDN